MTPFSLVQKSVLHYRRTTLAVIAGVAVAVSVLAGALLVGDSVRGSLKDLFLGRLGRASLVLSASHFFPEDLARRIGLHPSFQKQFSSLCPLVVVHGVVTHQESRRRASEVRVYGVDEQFWRFHEQTNSASFAISQRDAFVSQPLATEIGIQPGDSVLLRLEAASDIPAESLHGRRENRGRTVRLTAKRVLASGGLGEFSLSAEQQSVKSIFVPIGRLQKELGQEGQINGILISERAPDKSATEANSDQSLEDIVRQSTALEDLGIRLRRLQVPPGPETPAVECLSLEKTSTLLDAPLVTKARDVAANSGLAPVPVLTYLANRIRVGTHEVPYSLVAAVDPDVIRSLVPQAATTVTTPPIWLNKWAGADLNARPGDKVTLEYYVWREEGHITTQTSEFQLAGVIPIAGFAADRYLVPDYPGISDSDTLSDWDPPFPMDLGLIRPKDEAYWKEYRATPKAFMALADGQKLWQSRFGILTSLRFVKAPDNQPSIKLSELEGKFREQLRARLSPFETGFALLPVRAQGLAASRGSTDFGEYFSYFSFFLVASALLLATLFFRLGIEQRLREVGLLKALGFAPPDIRNLFLREGLLLAALGSLAGVLGALAYASLMVFLLRTWWVGAVGTTALSVHISSGSLLAGAASGILSAAGCIAWTLHRMMPASPRGLLAGVWTSSIAERGTQLREGHLGQIAAISFAFAGVLLLAGAASARLNEAAGFFGAGISLLVSLLCFQSFLLRRKPAQPLKAASPSTLWRLGFRQASDRTGRSLLCIALIASATFIIVAVDAFRREPGVPPKATGTEEAHIP